VNTYIVQFEGIIRAVEATNLLDVFTLPKSSEYSQLDITRIFTPELEVLYGAPLHTDDRITYLGPGDQIN